MSARRTLLELLDAALRAVDGRASVASALAPGGPFAPIFAIGKAASSMALGARGVLGECETRPRRTGERRGGRKDGDGGGDTKHSTHGYKSSWKDADAMVATGPDGRPSKAPPLSVR